jgi:hypothetical protein
LTTSEYPQIAALEKEKRRFAAMICRFMAEGVCGRRSYCSFICLLMLIHSHSLDVRRNMKIQAKSRFA